MKGRREFLAEALVIAGAAALVRAPRALAAGPALPAGLVYTAEKPGSWAGKEGSHAPKVAVEKGKVTVTTPHPMTAEHFIVRHTVVSAGGELVGGTTFTPSDPQALSTYDLPGGGTYYATSFCNLHDFWVTEFTA